MTKNPVSGISGVLSGLISTAPASSVPAGAVPAPLASAGPMPESKEVANPAAPRKFARRGRPPGRATASAKRREKVTLRIDASLVDDYRDWSWAQRCQLGELVERALSSYRKSR